MNKLVETIEGVFPNSRILLLYYSGSRAFNLEDENSDIDVTVVLDNFKGNMHINVGGYDLFVFSRESFNKKQTLSEEINVFYKSCADDILNMDKTLIFIEDEFKEKLHEYKTSINSKKYICNLLKSVISYSKIRFSIGTHVKAQYHLFRVRAMLDNYDRTGNFELVGDSSWMDKAREYKKNYDNEIGKEYISLLHEQLRYLEKYRNRMINSGLE